MRLPISGRCDTQTLLNLTDTACRQDNRKQGIVLHPDSRQLRQLQTGEIDGPGTKVPELRTIQRSQSEFIAKKLILALQQTIIRAIDRFIQHPGLSEQHRFDLRTAAALLLNIPER